MNKSRDSVYFWLNLPNLSKLSINEYLYSNHKTLNCSKICVFAGVALSWGLHFNGVLHHQAHRAEQVIENHQLFGTGHLR